MNEIDDDSIQMINWDVDFDFLESWKFAEISSCIKISEDEDISWLRDDLKEEFEK
jgi:hypothetical protein